MISLFGIPSLVSKNWDLAKNKKSFNIDYYSRIDSLRKIVSSITSIADTVIFANLDVYYGTRFYENAPIIFGVDISLHNERPLDLVTMGKIDSSVSLFIRNNFVGGNEYKIQYNLTVTHRIGHDFIEEKWIIKHEN